MNYETWKPVVGYESVYEVSDLGHVRSIDRVGSGRWGHRRSRGKDLRPSVNHNGHYRVTLQRDGHRRICWVHRLVLEAFVGPCPDGMEGCHDNGDPGDNRLANLRWDTHAANCADRDRHGTNVSFPGEMNAQARLTWDAVREIRERLTAGERQAPLALEFGVSISTISAIKVGKKWVLAA
jgi:hypothetical protein